MAFDEVLADRVGEELAGLPGLGTKRMFGGLVFLLHGNLLVGVYGDDLVARVGPDAAQACRALPGTRSFDITGKPMRGWLLVDGEVLDEDSGLADWIGRAREFVEGLPPK